MFTRWTRCKTPPPSSSPSYTPKKGPPLPHHRAKDNKIKPLVLFSGGRTGIQQPNLVPLPGQKAFEEPAPKCCRNRNDDSTRESSPPNSFPNLLDNEYQPLSSPPPPPTSPESRHRRKRLRQVASWQQEVLPSIVTPFMNLLAVTESLRHEVAAGDSTECEDCACESVRNLSILVVRFSKIESLHLSVCRCRPSAPQLIDKGLFPCAPHSPSLAVDVRLLEFALRLFNHIPPNTTAWCSALDGFLGMQGYKLMTKDSLRRRFGESLLWYSRLCDMVDHRITTIIQQSGSADESNTPTHKVNATTDGDSIPASPYPPPPPRSRPSEYLRRRCPLCFGGKHDSKQAVNLDAPDAIVCVDACFKQKRRKSPRDPAHFHPASVFVPETGVYAMEDIVNDLRDAPPPSKRPRTEPSQAVGDDGYEGSMRVPTSVLDGCEESFTAADERREKASTQFFDSTALMALLCRHDRVLWIVDMRSAGEKQHYVLILIETLFQHLPLNFTVGLLYDIGCQLHRSCVKWGYLTNLLPRLTFAISVFHAFGHQWPCQLIYHPRKCVGFGLSDGEGCERFWNSISKLISYLRVSGYHHRLYTLDRQIHHSDLESMERFAFWLVRRSHHCAEKHEEARVALKKVEHSEAYLRRQWQLQIASQTRPLPRRSKKKGKQAVEDALRAQKAQKAAQERLDSFLKIVASPLSDPYAVADAEIAIPEAQIAAEKAHKMASAKIRALGVDDQNKLSELVNNSYVNTRMNAQAVKIRLRDKLRSRKFELDRLRDVLPAQSNEMKIHSHTESAIKKRDPSIQQLARSYNQLVLTMSDLIKNKRAPSGAVAPAFIDTAKLFAMDVDNPIWWDDVHDGHEVVTPPAWLASESVRDGIRALLELDRCREEKRRLARERHSLQTWFVEEWASVNSALTEYQGQKGIQHQLHTRRCYLINLCATWQKAFGAFQSSQGEEPLLEWGPSHDELLNAHIHAVSGSYDLGDPEACYDEVDCQEQEFLETIESLIV